MTTTCGHPEGCTNDATHQVPRPATEAEAAAHYNAIELNIRSSGNPDYVHDRSGEVTVAEHRCDDPEHADAGYLEAMAAAGSQDNLTAP